MIVTTKDEQSRIAAQMLEKFLQEKNNRIYKNSVFVDLFSTDETAQENFLSLYNALHGTDFKLSETQVEIKTLERTLYMGFRNDVSALINGKLLVLVEHQSTINENMPLRFLEYVAQLYKQLVPLEKRYNRKTLEIPAPEFYVLYNGTEDYPSEKTLKLSDAFIGKKKDKASDTTDKSEENEKNYTPPLEILVKVININTVKQSAVLERCKVLSDYSSFIDIVRHEKAMGDEFFFYNAIQIAKQRDVLSDYLSRKTWEVSGMTFAEYDYDMDIAVQRQEAYEDGLEEGREEGITIGEERGISRGAHDKAIETARNFLTLGVGTYEQIAQATGLSLAEVQQLQIGMKATVR